MSRFEVRVATGRYAGYVLATINGARIGDERADRIARERAQMEADHTRVAVDVGPAGSDQRALMLPTPRRGRRR